MVRPRTRWRWTRIPSAIDGTSETITLTCRIDTAEEIEYFKNGGVLHYVLRNLAHAA